MQIPGSFQSKDFHYVIALNEILRLEAVWCTHLPSYAM